MIAPPHPVAGLRGPYFLGEEEGSGGEEGGLRSGEKRRGGGHQLSLIDPRDGIVL